MLPMGWNRSRALFVTLAVLVVAAGGVGAALVATSSSGTGSPATVGGTGTGASTSAPRRVGTATTAPATTAPATSTPAPGGAHGTQPHVMVIMLENHGYPQIVGSATAPYLNALIARYGLATASYADTHPSLPNYLDLVSGSTQGITTDCTTTCTANGPQLVDQLQAAGIGWRAYIESMPTPCYTGPTGQLYDRHHNPFVYAPHLVDNAAECANVVPLTLLTAQLAAGTAPTFLWITPNVQHDMHTGTVAQGDTWLAHELPSVMASSWYRSGGTIILTFDEGVTNSGCCGGAAGGHIATVVVSAATPRGDQLSTPVDHAGVLRTIEELYGLPFLGTAADPSSGTLLPLLGRSPG